MNKKEVNDLIIGLIPLIGIFVGFIFCLTSGLESLHNEDWHNSIVCFWGTTIALIGLMYWATLEDLGKLRERIKKLEEKEMETNGEEGYNQN